MPLVSNCYFSFVHTVMSVFPGQNSLSQHCVTSYMNENTVQVPTDHSENLMTSVEKV
jgi:hypothetical protein